MISWGASSCLQKCFECPGQSASISEGSALLLVLGRLTRLFRPALMPIHFQAVFTCTAKFCLPLGCCMRRRALAGRDEKYECYSLGQRLRV